MTLKEAEEYITKRILLHYDYDEARSISKIALSFLLKWNGVNYTLNLNTNIPESAFSIIHQYINRLQWAEPIQYITGEAHFMGFDFLVTPDVLIPRRETEELVQLIFEQNHFKNPLTILDVGTGSGCIPIMLKKKLGRAKVYAIDISNSALDIAEKNAKKLNSEITFLQADILKMEALSFDTFDVIVSNPPYVTIQEKELMHRNVTEFEPHLALFVKDDDPLIFYRKISELASKSLNSNGQLYFEINEKYANEVKEILLQFGFSHIEIIKDMQGKDRIVKGILN